MTIEATPQGSQEPGLPVEETGIEKFKSGKERDKAYVEAERALYEQTTRIKELERRLDEVATQVAQPPPPAPGQEQFTDVYKSQAEQDALKKFYTNPVQFIREERQAAARDAVAFTQTLLAHQQLVEQFKRDNPDLAKHEKVVAMYVQSEPMTLPPDERLNRAAKKAREYLLDIAGGKGNAIPPNPDAFVESPSGIRTPAPTPPPEKASSPDAELADYAKERAAWSNKRRIGG